MDVDHPIVVCFWDFVEFTPAGNAGVVDDDVDSSPSIERGLDDGLSFRDDVVRVGEGRSWARVALLVILIGSIPLTILPFFQTLYHNPIPTALGLVQVVLFTTAMVLLYDRNVSAWFRSIGNGQ